MIDWDRSRHPQKIVSRGSPTNQRLQIFLGLVVFSVVCVAVIAFMMWQDRLLLKHDAERQENKRPKPQEAHQTTPAHEETKLVGGSISSTISEPPLAGTPIVPPDMVGISLPAPPQKSAPKDSKDRPLIIRIGKDGLPIATDK